MSKSNKSIMLFQFRFVKLLKELTYGQMVKNIFLSLKSSSQSDFSSSTSSKNLFIPPVTQNYMVTIMKSLNVKS